MGVGSLLWGALSDRYGGRVVALIGGACSGWACSSPAR